MLITGGAGTRVRGKRDGVTHVPGVGAEGWCVSGCVHNLGRANGRRVVVDRKVEVVTR